MHEKQTGASPLDGGTARHRELVGMLGDRDYLTRWLRVRWLGKEIRTSEYQITNACNLRCKGCWFFEYEFDTRTADVGDPDRLETFLQAEHDRGVNASLVIGGEPTLFLDRLEAFVDRMDYVTVGTNGLRKLPWEGFERVALLVALFGGRDLDDELRAIRPGGRRFTGLFDEVLKNYRNDPRATFIFALAEDGVDQMEDAVKRIGDNGNRLHFSFYSRYGHADPVKVERERRLLDEALRLRQAHPQVVMSHPYFIETLITGRSHWASFGYEVCPSLSVDHPGHAARVVNGNPVLPGFNTWAADLKTLNFCCTSGHCGGCRDSQAVMSWLLVNPLKFRRDSRLLRTWTEIAESFWDQFIWARSLNCNDGNDVGFRVSRALD